MADNYGPEQPEVFDIKDRSWGSVVFGRGIPVKSTDWNLIGQIADDKARQAQLLPSGWLQVGEASLVAPADTASAELAAVDGQIITSEGYQADSFKLISKGGLRAVINGWPLVVQGTDSVDINNVITLESMASTSSGRLDFVFLEAWRELVDKDGVVYQYGNTDADTLENDLDTAKRIQLRYRIRVSSGISGTSDGFDGSVKAAGALPAGSVTSYVFTNQVDNGDAGLWKAGDGSTSAKTALGTVDGYSYAIPMFAVYRRGHSAGFSTTDISSTAVSKGDAVVSDRPDGYYYDVVYPSDILDLRHRILVGRDISALVEKTFKSLAQGTLRTRRGLVRDNSGYIDMPGGSLILKGEEFGSDTSGLPYLGTMQSTGALPQRALCNATVTHRNNIVAFTPLAPWSTSSTEYVYLGAAGYVYADLPVGVYRIDTMASLDIVTDITFSMAPDRSVLYVTIPTGSTLIGLSTPIKIQLEVDYLAIGNGLLDVPENILSIQNNLTGAVIPARDGAVISVPGAPIASEDYIAHRGAEEGSTHDQGIEVVTHLTMSAPSTTSIPLVGGKLHGHSVVGIRGVQRGVSGVYGPYEAFDVQRIISGSDIEYVISGVTDIASSASQEVRITFLANTKFFETSRQGRGITETYETLEVAPLYIGGEFYVDTGDKPLLAICQAALTQGGFAQGLPYAYVNGVKRLLEPLTTGGIPMVNRLPIIGEPNYVDGEYLPTRVKIEFQGAAVLPSDAITVPVIVHSNVLASESYTIYYTTTGYQGTSSSIGKTGSIEFAGQHLLTTSGSGTIKDYSFSGSAQFGMNVDKRLVIASTGVNWLGQIKTGDYLSKNSEPAERYRVASVTSGTEIVLEDAYYGASEEVAFTSVRKDIAAAGPYCVIDRMPATTFDGWKAKNQAIWGSAGTSVSSLPNFAVADPSGAIRGDVRVGNVGLVAQGRTGLLLSIKGSDRFQLAEQYPDVSYGPIQVYGPTIFQKIFQSYLFVEDSTGILYLAVVAGESQTNNDLVRLTGYAGTDVVDVFEIIGRPLAPRG